MARPKKATVDYFPHYVHHGKTLFILEKLYGDHGYAFFYKLLETLADSEGHYYDCRNTTAMEFLQAKTSTNEIPATDILERLASMGIIDPELWKIGIIWMESFVQSIKDVYANRRVSTPNKPMVSEFLQVETPHKTPISTDDNPQSKVKETKVNKKHSKRVPLTDTEYFELLKSNPAYKGIDIDRERGKCEAWCLTANKVFSRRRFINWLNRAEKPIEVEKKSYYRPAPVKTYEHEAPDPEKYKKVDNIIENLAKTMEVKP